MTGHWNAKEDKIPHNLLQGLINGPKGLICPPNQENGKILNLSFSGLPRLEAALANLAWRPDLNADGAGPPAHHRGWSESAETPDRSQFKS